MKSPQLLEAGKIGHVTYVLKGTIYYETTLEATLVVNCHERKHQDSKSKDPAIQKTQILTVSLLWLKVPLILKVSPPGIKVVRIIYLYDVTTDAMNCVHSRANKKQY